LDDGLVQLDNAPCPTGQPAGPRGRLRRAHILECRLLRPRGMRHQPAAVLAPLDRGVTARDDRRRSVAIAALFALFFGTWALCANLAHGLPRGLEAALVQACMSFSMSFCIVEGMHAMERALGTSPWARVATAFVPSLAADAVIATAHLCAGTPEILRTILPGLVLGTVSSCLYVAGRGHARRRALRGEGRA